MRKNDEGRMTARDHKLSFDEYSGKFYFESKIEGIERTCRTRLKHIEAMNKGEALVMDGQHRQLAGKMHIFDMKHIRESDTLKLSLQDLAAHRQALEEVWRNNNSHPLRNDNMGRYGLSSTRQDLIDLIGKEKLKMDPTWRRKRQCQLLLNQRKPMDVIDRGMSTSRIMLSWRRKPKMDEGVEGGDYKTLPRIVLPPLKVSNKGLAKSMLGELPDNTEQGEPDPETTSLPHVFITHMPKPEIMPT